MQRPSNCSVVQSGGLRPYGRPPGQSAFGRVAREWTRSVGYNFAPLRTSADRRPSPMSQLAKSFEPHAIEEKWYPIWEARGDFEPSWKPGAPPYCIQLPPPNVTGTLHMGHAFQHTLMDVLIRYHRMRGFNTLWQLGTDHAGIATQIVVENQLRAEGRTRHDLGREKFVERVWQWKEESGSTITQPDAPARRVGRLVARALHDGRRALRRGARNVRATPRGRTHLPRQAARQLGSDARHRGVRPRGRQRGRAGQALGNPLPARRKGQDRSSSRRRARRPCWATLPSP